MKDYRPEDFASYYQGAWFLHPEDKVFGYIQKVGDENSRYTCTCYDLVGGKLSSIDYRTLSFEAFNSNPPLGYRHLEDGKWLFYICKRAMRRRAKGLRADSVVIRPVLEIETIYRMAGQGMSYRRQQAFTGGMLQEIFTPTYKSIEEAVATLINKEDAVGFALSPDIAITLLTYKTSRPFVMLFKGQQAAYSTDGVLWKPSHPEYLKLLTRHLPTIQLEN